MGYPKCTAEAIREAEKLKKSGMKNKDIAACIGVSERNFYRWVNEPKTENQRQFGQALKNAEAAFKTSMRMKIIQASNDSWQAAAWMLERLYPDEYGKKVVDQRVTGKVEVSGIDPKVRDEMDRLLGLDG